jgi:hypothetical protein
MKLNEKLIRISAGYIPITQDLTLGTEVIIQAKGTVVKEEKQDQQDGSYNLVHVIKIPFVEDVKVEAE